MWRDKRFNISHLAILYFAIHVLIKLFLELRLKDIKIILEGKAFCHRHRLIQKNQLWRVASDLEVTTAPRHEVLSYSFGYLLRDSPSFSEFLNIPRVKRAP